MTIIQELPSSNGNIRLQVIENVLKVVAVDNYKLGNRKQPVILCHLPDHKKYAIGYFMDNTYRDQALHHILDQHTLAVLELNEFFEIPVADIDNIPIEEHMMWLPTQIQNIVHHEALTIGKLIEREAFKCFNASNIYDLLAGTYSSYLDEEKLPYIWSKTLQIPYGLKLLKFTNLQFTKRYVQKFNQNLFNKRRNG